MKVLFIGATGLVGSHVVPFLKEKFELSLAAINSDNIAGMAVTAVDICDWDAIEAFIQKGASDGDPFDAVVYCATANYRENRKTDVEGQLRYYENCIEVNARGAYHVFEASWRANVKKVIHIGSMTSVLGLPHYEVIDAQTRDRPNDLYAATKIFGENVGHSYAGYAERPDGSPLPMQVLCLRLGQPFSSEDSWRKSPRASRLAIDVEDIASAIECVLLADIQFGIYPVVSEVENPWVAPSAYAEIGYKPVWKFTPEGRFRVKLSHGASTAIKY